jgi:hypothetical protein
MFEKLLSLLLHAKGGALATVLVLGTSGALVTATVQNGNATITITQPSSGAAETAVTPVTVTTASNTTSNNTTVDPAILALFNRTKAEDDPTSPATGGNGCSDAAKAINEQVKRVNDAFKTDLQAIEKARKDARTDTAKKAVSDALKAITGIRQAAVKAIHATNPSATCKNDDEDVNEQQGDNNDKNDANDTNDNNDVDNEQDGEHDDDNGTTPPAGGAPTTTVPTTPAVVFSGDAKAIADAAISAMALWVTDVKAAIAAQPAATTTTNTSKQSDKAKSDNKSNRTNATKQSSKGKGGDHEGDD